MSLTNNIRSSHVPSMGSKLVIDICSSECDHTHVKSCSSCNPDSMHGTDHLSHVLDDNVHPLLVPARPELCRHQGLAQLLLARHANRLAVVECSLAATGSELLVQDRIEDDANLGHFIDPQANRYARVWEAVHKVHCTVDRIDNPGGFIAQQLLLALASLFFANEPGRRF